MAKEGGAERFLRAAAELGIDVEPVTYPDGTRTAADAATAIGCELSQIAKSLLVMTDTGPVLALTAGHNRLNHRPWRLHSFLKLPTNTSSCPRTPFSRGTPTPA